jgi:hypothetical protein
MFMKRIITSVTLRAVVATALCVSFIMYLPLRVSSAGPAALVATDLKSESQFRTEASRYDGAIRAISGIATTTLETPDDLKKALDILNREHPNLKLHHSKLVVMALSDTTLVSAVKKKVPDKRAAETFVRELDADPRAVLKLNGAESLASRIQRSREADAAALRRAADKLKEAAEKIKNARNAGMPSQYEPADELKLIRAGLSAETQPAISHTATLMPPLDPVSTVIVSILIAVFVVGVLYPLAFAITLQIVKLVTIEQPDEFAECQQRRDDRLSVCLREANNLPAGLPFFQRETATALCYAERLQGEVTCLLTY